MSNFGVGVCISSRLNARRDDIVIGPGSTPSRFRQHGLAPLVHVEIKPETLEDLNPFGIFVLKTSTSWSKPFHESMTPMLRSSCVEARAHEKQTAGVLDHNNWTSRRVWKEAAKGVSSVW